MPGEDIYPAWVPDRLQESDLQIEKLYEFFQKCFIKEKLKLDGHNVYCVETVDENGYAMSFNHIITKEKIRGAGERLFDKQRASRLLWCPAIIKNANKREVKSWFYREGKKSIRRYLWLEKLNYVVILQKKTKSNLTVYYLVTAFYITGSSTKRNLQRKYENKLK